MKYFKTLSLLVVALFVFIISAQAQVNPSQTYVQGYTRADGTYVSGYYKTTPNETNRDNFTTKPNVNPYTGKPGTIEPDSKPSTTTYTTPTSTYTTPTTTYSTPASTSKTIYTGPQGGQYYINSNGNKTYIKH